ncbi:DMT family transporter [Sulfitobacter sp. D35]|uniref:DMT family transporter n=1 Tax=Sulfitobacter sp. D35 TaxID=3083252 RepID=UPI00296E55BD|nr:DMT family transporter [Sulfitobacter sp. D35]MDW4499588.1 DMT family transporter [Sulfitobacter sp. D35]
MTRREVLFYTAILAVLGAGWGITQPLSKIAVSTGYKHFGLVFWQLAIGAAVLSLIAVVRGTGFPREARHIRLYVIIALIGTILPNSAGYQAAVHLPSGILSLLLSMVPMWAFPIALLLGNDSFSPRRLYGLLAGLAGVLLIMTPGLSLPDGVALHWVLVGLVSSVFYAFEGNYVAKWGTEGLDTAQVLTGASLVGTVLAFPIAVFSDQFIAPVNLAVTTAGQALVVTALVHVAVYTAYVWLVGRTGAVFTAQVSYLVTGFGILWAKLILDESYSPFVWVALGSMFLGMYLVQPRPKAALAALSPTGDTRR